MWRSYGILFSFISIILLQIFSTTSISRAEKDKVKYISDVLVINIKDRLEKPYEVTATVQSDDPVQIIEESGNYFKVETAEGKQGWIAKHYLKSELPKTLLIQKLKQETAHLREQLTSKPFIAPEENIGNKTPDALLCQDIQQKLSDAEKHIAQLLEEQKKNHDLSILPSPISSRSVVDENLVSTDNMEQSPENYALLISEYEKRGQLISDLQKTLSKKEDQTRFLWFVAGAAVFLIGMLAGRTSNRKKNKFMY